jgi:hypothetical protein
VSYLRPAFPWHWVFWGGTATFIVGLVLLVSWCDDQSRLDCESKGGQYVHVYKGALCVKPGTVLQ